MDPTEKVEDERNVLETSEYSDYDLWDTFYEDEGYEERTVESFEEDEVDEHEDIKEPEEIDIFAEFAEKLGDERTKKLLSKAEEKQKKLQLIIGIDKKKDVSEETLITPEEEATFSLKSSSESSIHHCFRDIDISDSQLKLSNLFTMYPVPDDPGLVPAFWTIFVRPPIYEEHGVEKFVDLTKKLGLKPIKSVEEMLLTDTINLQYYGLDSRIVRVICEAVMDNPRVETIDLKGNWLSVDACYHLGELLRHNNVLLNLNLAECRIGREGVAKLSRGISNNATLTKLDLSSCKIGDEGLTDLAEAICKNKTLKSLNLSNNNLTESCKVSLQYLLSCSMSLKELKLSWNSIYTTETWKMLVKGLEKNQTLTDLDFSWNALGNECVPFVSQLLSRSLTLEKLDLSGNRFNEADAIPIARGLLKNKNLEELYLGNNPLNAAGAFSLVQAATQEKSQGSKLRVLDLTNVWANKDIHDVYSPVPKLLEYEKPSLQVRLGGVLGNYKIHGPDPKKIFLKRANFEAMKPKRKKQRKDFGHFVLSLTDDLISRPKFNDLVKSFRLKLTNSLIEEIMNAFANAQNMVDLGFLKSFYLEQYPNTKPPKEKPIKKKKTKGHDTKKNQNLKKKGITIKQ